MEFIKLKIEFISLVVSIFSFFISCFSFRKASETFNEEYNGKVVSFFEVRDGKIYIVIKNIGRNIAYNINVDFYEKLSTIIHPDFKKIVPLITDYKNYTLVPGQELAEQYDITKYKFRKFNVKIKYDSLGKKFTENYKLDTYYLDHYKEINEMKV